MKISFIGFGNIAQALAVGLSKNKDYELFAAAPSLSTGVNTEGVQLDASNLAVIKNADIVILAVKPANMEAVLEEIKDKLLPNCLVISVAASLSLSWLESRCRKQQALLRAMPNLAGALHQGATPLLANDYVSNLQKEQAEQLFKTLGLTTWVKEEKEIAIFTALSGSGPAYVFLFLEALIKGAKQLGLEEAIAKDFSLQTAIGALALLAKDDDISAVRKKVTSTGGTTAAATAIFQQGGFDELVFKAMEAACNRAEQLSVL